MSDGVFCYTQIFDTKGREINLSLCNIQQTGKPSQFQYFTNAFMQIDKRNFPIFSNHLLLRRQKHSITARLS